MRRHFGESVLMLQRHFWGASTSAPVCVRFSVLAMMLLLAAGCGDNKPTPIPMAPDSGGAGTGDASSMGNRDAASMDASVAMDGFSPPRDMAPPEPDVFIPPDGAVLECEGNSDCPGAQTCADGFCLEAARCVNDEDCFTGQMSRCSCPQTSSSHECPGKLGCSAHGQRPPTSTHYSPRNASCLHSSASCPHTSRYRYSGIRS